VSVPEKPQLSEDDILDLLNCSSKTQTQEPASVPQTVGDDVYRLTAEEPPTTPTFEAPVDAESEGDSDVSSCSNCGRRALSASPVCLFCGFNPESGVHPPSRKTIDPELGRGEPHRGALIFGVAIASLFCCGLILGPIAWQMASADLRKMDEGLMDPGGRTLTQMGRIIAIIGTAGAVLAIVLKIAGYSQ